MQSTNVKSDSESQHRFIARRLLCTLVYSLGIFAAISILGVLIVSADCQIDGKCGVIDRMVDATLSGVWLIATLYVAFRAWRGDLPGCRRKQIN